MRGNKKEKGPQIVRNHTFEKNAKELENYTNETGDKTPLNYENHQKKQIKSKPQTKIYNQKNAELISSTIKKINHNPKEKQNVSSKDLKSVSKNLLNTKNGNITNAITTNSTEGECIGTGLSIENKAFQAEDKKLTTKVKNEISKGENEFKKITKIEEETNNKNENNKIIKVNSKNENMKKSEKRKTEKKQRLSKFEPEHIKGISENLEDELKHVVQRSNNINDINLKAKYFDSNNNINKDFKKSVVLKKKLSKKELTKEQSKGKTFKSDLQFTKPFAKTYQKSSFIKLMEKEKIIKKENSGFNIKKNSDNKKEDNENVKVSIVQDSNVIIEDDSEFIESTKKPKNFKEYLVNAKEVPTKNKNVNKGSNKNVTKENKAAKEIKAVNKKEKIETDDKKKKALDKVPSQKKLELTKKGQNKDKDQLKYPKSKLELKTIKEKQIKVKENKEVKKLLKNKSNECLQLNNIADHQKHKKIFKTDNITKPTEKNKNSPINKQIKGTKNDRIEEYGAIFNILNQNIDQIKEIIASKDGNKIISGQNMNPVKSSSQENIFSNFLSNKEKDEISQIQPLTSDRDIINQPSSFMDSCIQDDFYQNFVNDKINNLGSPNKPFEFTFVNQFEGEINDKNTNDNKLEKNLDLKKKTSKGKEKSSQKTLAKMPDNIKNKNSCKKIPEIKKTEKEVEDDDDGSEIIENDDDEDDDS